MQINIDQHNIQINEEGFHLHDCLVTGKVKMYTTLDLFNLIIHHCNNNVYIRNQYSVISVIVCS